jgi:predicted ATP-dependent endonuclease of OLD family
MLENLHVKNFRMLADFTVPKLGKVNLIVGKNNSGKSSVLEALRIYAARSNPRTLFEIAASHDEISNMVASSEDGSEAQQVLPFKDFFYGRQFPTHDNTDAIYIGNVEHDNFVTIDHTFFTDDIQKLETPSGEETRRRRVMISKQTFLTEPILAEQALVVTVNDSSAVGWVPLNEALLQNPRRPGTNLFWDRGTREIPVSYVPTQFLSMDYLAFLWDSILFSPLSEEVKGALRIIDSDFEDLGFVKTSSDDYRSDARLRMNRMRARSDRSAVVKLKGSTASIPLSSMGDGMFRVLQLALTIFPAKGGILLIDEFENGLHWSVQEKIWLMIFKLARDLDIQVFATTHSEDAVRAFSDVAKAAPEEGVLIKLVRNKCADGMDKTIAVVYDEDTLQTATQTETEIR